MRGSKKKIRKARRADAAAILTLEKYFPGDRLSRRSVRALLRARSAQVLLAESGRQALGAAVLLTRRNSRTARIYSVVVAPPARGAGLGRALVESAEAAARRRGCRAVSLEVRENGRAARALYRKLGYRELARLPDYYEDGAAALRLGKVLV